MRSQTVMIFTGGFSQVISFSRYCDIISSKCVSKYLFFLNRGSRYATISLFQIGRNVDITHNLFITLTHIPFLAHSDRIVDHIQAAHRHNSSEWLNMYTRGGGEMPPTLATHCLLRKLYDNNSIYIFRKCACTILSDT